MKNTSEPLRQPDVFERTEPLCSEIASAIDDAQVAARGLTLNRHPHNAAVMAAAEARISNKLNQAAILCAALRVQLAREMGQ